MGNVNTINVSKGEIMEQKNVAETVCIRVGIVIFDSFSAAKNFLIYRIKDLTSLVVSCKFAITVLSLQILMSAI